MRGLKERTGNASRDITIGKIVPYMALNGKIIIDDAKRESECITKWTNYYGLQVEIFQTVKGMAILT